MKTVYCSFDGRYSDNPRALYRSLSRRGDHDSHVWLYHPKHGAGFPAGVAKVPYGSAAALDALESADLVVANTHLELEWAKKPGATYLQTWHGTPLKRIHYDVLFAPAGRLARLGDSIASHRATSRSSRSRRPSGAHSTSWWIRLSGVPCQVCR